MDSKYDRNIETDYKQQMSNENDVFMLKHRKERQSGYDRGSKL